MMISTFDSLKAMNEKACYESTIEEKACERVYCKKSMKALSLSEKFLNVIVKKMRIVWKRVEWMTMLDDWKRKMYVYSTKKMFLRAIDLEAIYEDSLL